MSAPSGPAVVYVVDDDASVRDSTVLFLAHRGWAVRAFDSAEQFLESFDPEAPGCLLLDLRMPGMSGLELQGVLVERHIDLPIIFLTGHGDVRQTVTALKRGAVDFLEKPWDHDVLEARIVEAVNAQAARHADRDARRDRQARHDALTPREREVFDLLVAGLSSKMIGRELAISHRTVEVHRANVMRKMKADSLAALLAGLSR